MTARTTHRSTPKPLSRAIRAVLAFGCGWGIAAPPALAQDEAGLQLDEIVVTARKQQENLQDVPISITAFSAADIANFGFQTLEDIDTTVPNFRLNKSQGFGLDEAISIRGVTSRESASGFEPTFAVVLDDVYVGHAMAYTSTLLDMERIEVLRGPQGTLQGRNVVGGAINMETAKPTDEFHARARMSYGRFDTWSVDGLVSGPLQKGSIAGKLAVSYSDSEGPGNQVDTGDDIGGGDTAAMRAQLRFTPRSDLEILITGDYATQDEQPEGLDTDPDFTLGHASKALLDRKYGGDFMNDVETDTWGVAANVYYDFANGMRLVSVTSSRGFEVDSVLDQDNAATFSVGGFAAHSLAERDQDQFSQELRLHSAQDQAVRWLAGVYYFTEDLRSTDAGIFGPYIPGMGAIGSSNLSDADIETDSLAAFGSLAWDMSDCWNMTLGLRADDNEREIEVLEVSRFDGFLPAPFPPAPFVAVSPQNPVPTSFAVVSPFPLSTNSIDDQELSGDFTVTYKWTDDVSTYAKYARGFKGGGFNSGYSLGQAAGEVEPEFVDSWELGLRSYLLDRRVRLNATAFYLEYTDQQVTDFVAGPGGITFITFNAPETQSHGAEVELSALLLEGLNLNLSLGLLDTEYTKGTNDGKTPFNSPDVTFSSVLQYVRPVGANLELFLLGEASWSDEYFTDVNNNPINLQEDYWMLNARAGVQAADGGWALRVFGRNLLDEDIQTLSLNIPGVFTLLALQDPRTYGVELTVSF